VIGVAWRRLWRMLRTLVVLAALALGAVYGTRIYRARMAKQVVPVTVPTAKVLKGDLAVLLAGNGVLEAEKTYVIANQQVMSKITKIVEDGALVKKGEVIVELDRTKIEKERAERQLAYDQAKAQIAKSEAENLLNLNNAATKTKKAKQEHALLVTTNRAQLDQVSSELTYNRADLGSAERQQKRKKALAAELLIPARDAELAELNVASKGLNVAQSEKKLSAQQFQEKASQAKGDLLISDAKFSEETTRIKAAEQIKNARFNADSAKQMLELSEMQLQWCTVVAPVSGLAVVAREWDGSGGPRALRAGDNVYPMRRFMDIIDLSRMRIVTNVSEMDIGHVRKGMRVRIRPRSSPDTLLNGRVSALSRLARTGDVWRRNAIPGKKIFRMQITIDESRPNLLRPGMSADYEIVEQVLGGVVTVPIQAVFRTRQGPAVFVKQGSSQFRVRPVKTGTRNHNRIVITHGLKGNEEIALQRPPLSLIESIKTPKKRTSQTGSTGSNRMSMISVLRSNLSS
jgi:multidrug efflux pump subunit AcrA (membrane-fusion protein)